MSFRTTMVCRRTLFDIYGLMPKQIAASVGQAANKKNKVA